MVFAFLLIIYLLGYLTLLSARTGLALGVRFMVSIAIVLGSALIVSLGGGLMVLALALPLALFAAGVVAGACTRAALFALGWIAKSVRGALVSIFGILFVPIALQAHWYHQRWQLREMYATLPTAHSLPSIPACNAFREAGAMIDAIMTLSPGEQRPRWFPAKDIPVLYPAVYTEPSPPFFPRPAERVWSLDFEMYVSDAQPAPPTDDRDATGKYIQLDHRRPSIHFSFKSRRPISKHGIVLLNIMSLRQIAELEKMPEIRLAESPYPGLSLVVAPAAKGYNAQTKSFIAKRNNEIAELVQCSGQGTFPQCSFSLDESGIPVEGFFPETSLANWQLIQTNIRNFAMCSVEAAKVVRR